MAIGEKVRVLWLSFEVLLAKTSRHETNLRSSHTVQDPSCAHANSLPMALQSSRLLFLLVHPEATMQAPEALPLHSCYGPELWCLVSPQTGACKRKSFRLEKACAYAPCKQFSLLRPSLSRPIAWSLDRSGLGAFPTG